VGTVRPYAERIGAVIETEPAFTIPPAGGSDRIDAARRRMTELLAQPSPMVICGHRENMPVLLDQARAVLPGFPPDDEWAPPKAGFWVLHVAGGRLAALEHHTTSD
jgi:hypothetical protein